MKMSVHSNMLVQLFHTAQPVRVVETGLSIQKFPLLIEIRRIDKDQFIARIPIPDGYSSALTKQLKEDFGLNEFGVIHLSSSLDEEFKYNECFLSVKTSPPWPQDEPPYLTVIHSFYMFHRMVNTHNGEELKLLKLLGVKMAAHVLKEVQGKSRRRAHWVFAEASGGNDIVPKQESKRFCLRSTKNIRLCCLTLPTKPCMRFQLRIYESLFKTYWLKRSKMPSWFNTTRNVGDYDPQSSKDVIQRYPCTGSSMTCYVF
jgi:hypothetical protein